MKKEILIRLSCLLALCTPVLLATCDKGEAIQISDTSIVQQKKLLNNIAVQLVKECTFTQGLRFRSTSVNIPYSQVDKRTIEKAILKLHRLIKTKDSVPHIREHKSNAAYVGLTIIEEQSYEVKVLEKKDHFNLQLGYYY